MGALIKHTDLSLIFVTKKCLKEWTYELTRWMLRVLTETYHFWHLYTTNPEIYFIFLNEKNLKRTMKRKAGWMGMERTERGDS